MKGARRIVLLAAMALFAVWAAANSGRLAGGEDGLIRFVLGTVFALLLLLRQKAERPAAIARRAVPAAAALGTGAALAGLIFNVHQFEWIGVLLVLYACLRWALPERYDRDLMRALLILYWAHPLPGQLFGRLEFGMQWLTVQGSEWFLQAANVRVWADGFFLRTGFRVFGVPEACSGMRTAVTVMLCALGIGLLFRFRWYEVAGCLVLGLAQVLLLNIVRVAAMLYWAPRMPEHWAENFLHDTLGLFLLVTIVLVQFEAAGWQMHKARRRKRESADENPAAHRPDYAHLLPRFWRNALRWSPLVLLALLVIGTAAGLAYKRRPFHRAAMIEGVAEGLLESDLSAAERALNAALELKPGDRNLLALLARACVLQGKLPQALRLFNEMPTALSAHERVMKSWCLMGLGRPEEAIRIIDALPEHERRVPAVAMIRAEYAAMQDRPEEVSRNVVRAAQWHVTVRRVRALFPYLYSRRQWRAIVQCENAHPFEDISHALIAVHAHLKTNDPAGAARNMRRALERWPNDPRFLSSLLSLASGRPGSQWEDLFARNLKANLNALDAAQLAAFLDAAFGMRRPDLAWLLFARLRAEDPRDPALSLAAAQHGENWFVFRRNRVGLSAEDHLSVIDLRSFYLESVQLEPFRRFWQNVPMAVEMGRGHSPADRTAHLEACLAELERREREGALNRRMQMIYPMALSLAGRFPEAHDRLDRIAERYPERKGDVLLQHAVLHAQEERWEDMYEALREYYTLVQMPSLRANLMFVRALMHLNMGVAAMEVARQTERLFPGSPEIDLLAAGIWDVFGFTEQALHVLNRSSGPDDIRIKTQLLLRTGRVHRHPLNVDLAAVRQNIEEPPAELTIAKRWPAPLLPAEMDERAARLERDAAASVSPFARSLLEFEAAWFRARGEGEPSEFGRWARLGRDDTERATALHRLSMLLARQERFEAAARAARLAIGFMPGSAILWRALVALESGAADTVAEARRNCPDDPDLWLASIVTDVQSGDAEAARRKVRAAAETGVFPAATMVRAGDFLLRRGLTDAAETAARAAVARGEGLVSAYMLGLRCALTLRNVAWALECAAGGSDHGLDPAPFYAIIVDLKSASRSSDADLFAALEHLRARFPEQTVWAEQLGFLYFQERDTKRALNVLEPALSGTRADKPGLTPLLLAAEAARLEGDHVKAVRILEEAYRLYPENPAVLNNLVYTLAQETASLPRARALLPALLDGKERSFVFLDTAAMVLMRSGQFQRAWEYMQEALAQMDPRHYAAPEVRLNAAELLLRLGRYAEARERLLALRRETRDSRLVDLKARQLLRQIEEEYGRTTGL